MLNQDLELCCIKFQSVHDVLAGENLDIFK